MEFQDKVIVIPGGGGGIGKAAARRFLEEGGRVVLNRRSNLMAAHKITRAELKASIDAGEVTVVETLRSEHFEQGHLPGAIQMHFEEVADKAAALLPDRDAAIVTYCSNTACQNSEAAANQLTAMGYSNVRKYAEGKDDWTEAGLALETRAATAA